MTALNMYVFILPQPVFFEITANIKVVL
jgi:hypothetical protein